ncbi:antimicrobial peptide, SdpC family [Chitinophaga terrae (ex Kim and Jung 2007)]|uniref:Antimicrobial peptide, SdpC family n=1 Tax=Chitinophaga terrae (ex Kim and Jung 2007) TaxID=408074 RepID=A0A1H4GB98_9BACT|nr:hypothetical protein [Chitinophaga terrae (ex Kim and Jung 2007)]GEP93297.1 hypothetical protein CTE07_49420 [Chitinophaga terrae (ex Kim and Jung 2007)]SEB06923.1 antimicrobial peptide, SdpC family [Chitinophaga terrae (ex Kim and Jung 2007)]
MKRFIWIPVAILGIVSAIVGCKKSADQDLASRKDYTPEDIYRGIILGDGEVATQIPELSKNKSVVGTISEEQKKKNAQAEDQIISFVNSNFPGFLQEFKTEILSRDAIRIDNALKKASDITLKAVFLTKVSKFAKNETEGKKIIYAALQKNPLKFNTLMHDLRNKRIQDKSEIERRVTEIFDLHSSNVKILGNNFARTAEDDG